MEKSNGACGARKQLEENDDGAKKEDYDSELDHAKKALHNVIRVYEDGFYQSEDSTRINYQLFIQATVAIKIILGIIYALRNRKKLISLVSGEEYEEIGFERL